MSRNHQQSFSNPASPNWFIDSDSIIDSFTAEQRNALLLQYAANSSTTQVLLDNLLKRLAKKDHTLLVTYKAEVESEAKKKGKTFGPEEFQLQNKSILLDQKKFWHNNSRRNLSVPVESDEDLALVKILSSYVPKLVVRRLYNNAIPIQAPEIETYPACVMFADISGFTPLTEKMAKLGLEGVEKLTTELNKYFDKLIGIIYKYGGDIVKFAGDAVMVVWPTESRPGLSGAILLACQSAQALLGELADYTVEGTGCVLRLHIGIGAGEVAGIHVGGTNSQLEFFISGPVLEQVSQCEKLASPGEVVVSGIAWLAVESGRMTGVAKSKGSMAHYRLVSVDAPVEFPKQEPLRLFKDMEVTLKQYIQPSVLRHIDSGTKQWLAELRNVSVIFVNLTAPFKEYKLQELQTTITEMQAIIYKYEGIIRQFMIDDKGSVLIAGFGLPPLSHEDDPARAVISALEITAKLQQLRVPCSIGVTTGKAFCGDVGADHRREYAMVGDIVNLSARLMAAAKAGILVDSDTYEACRASSQLGFEKLDDIMVKGKANPIPVYVPSKQKKPTSSHENSGYQKKILVGRESELGVIQSVVSKMKATLEAGKRCKTRTIVIEGDPGVGKTSLVEHLIDSFTQNHQPVYSGASNLMETSKPYHVWKEIFANVLDKEGALPQSILSQLDADLLPLLNVVLPLNMDESPKLRTMSGQMRSEATQLLLISLLRLFVKPGSLLILENGHWMDSGSWGLALAATTQLDGVLVVVSMRHLKSPVFQYSQMINQQKTQHIQLRNLTEEESAQLIAALLKVKKIPDNMAKSIQDKGQGNPFLTEEIVYAVRDSGALQITKNGECIMTAEAEESLKAVPNSLSSLLTSRVDRLSPSQQVMLKVASVIGQTFSLNTLSQLLPEGTDKSSLRREMLETLSMIQLETPDPNLSYSFVNTMMRDVVYGLMLFSQRRTMHKNLASLYQKEYLGDSTYYPILAYHFKQAEEDNEAIQYFLKSGSNCLYSYAHKEAVDFFTEAIQLSAKIQKIATLEAVGMERKLGQAYYSLGQFKSADEHFRKALDFMAINIPAEGQKITNKSLNKIKVNTWTFTQEREPKISPSEVQHRKREAVLCLIALTKSYLYSCNRPLATYCNSLALKLTDNIGASLLAEVYATATLIAGINGDHQSAENYILKGTGELAVKKQLDIAKILDQSNGMYYSGISKWAKAEECFHKAIEVAHSMGDLRTYEECKVLLGTCYYLKGDVKRSVVETAEALESAQLRGDASIQMMAMNTQATNYYALGEYAHCIKCIENVGVILKSGASDSVFADINFAGLMSLIHWRKGEYEACWKLAEKGLQLVGNTEPATYFAFSGYACLAEIFVLISQNVEIWPRLGINKQKILSKAEKMTGILQKFAQVFTFAAPRADFWRGALNYLNGKTAKAEQEWNKCIEAATSMGVCYEQALILYHMGEITGSEINTAQAARLFPEIRAKSRSMSNILDSKGKYE